VDFNGADLSYTNLSEADFSEACLGGANLFRADLSGADLFKVDLSGANLNRANLLWVDLRQANLSGANLTYANFSRAKLKEADFSQANMGLTTFGGVDLSEAKGLDQVIHHAPSTLGVDTLCSSRGKIPELFLRGCGLTDFQIETAKFNRSELTFDQIISITTNIQEQMVEPSLSTCFISFVNGVEDFAQQLHDDLQQYGVRCLLAAADEDNIQSSADDTIRYHVKLLLLLSEHSMQSDWMGREVEAALREEDRRSETVILPLQLDDTIETGPAWIAKLRQSHPVRDFSQWRDSEAYQQALARLLRDLVVEEE
jgi:hypothetical protein